MHGCTKRILAVLIFEALSPLAGASPFIVNSDADPSVGDASNCLAGNVNTCTLRDAIASAGSGGTIAFQSDMVVSLVSGQTLTLSDDVTIDGSGHAVTVSGIDAVTVFTIGSGANVAIKHLTIANGYDHANGGGIYNKGSLILTDSTLTGNNAPYGGAAFNFGTLTLTRCTVTANKATGSGGGISNGYNGSLTIADSTIAGNQGFWGGGVANIHGNAILVNSTLSGNTANAGGAMRNWNATATLTNATIAGNSAWSEGDGIYNRYGTVSFTNTIAADNCSGTQSDAGGNLDAGETCGFSAATSHSHANLDLGPLQDNGGPTRTRMPGLQSAALDAGLDSACSMSPVDSSDQRGSSRPAGVHCDSGALERQNSEDHVFNNNFDSPGSHIRKGEKP